MPADDHGNVWDNPSAYPTTWIEVDRRVRVKISAKDLVTFLTTPAHLVGIDKKGLIEMDFASGFVTVTCTTGTCSDRKEAAVVDPSPDVPEPPLPAGEPDPQTASDKG